MQYRFVVKDNNEKVFRVFNWFLLCLHIAAAGMFALSSSAKALTDFSTSVYYACIAFYVMAAGVMFVYRNDKSFFNRYRFIIYTVYAACWLVAGFYIAAAILAAVIFLAEKTRKQQTSIAFSETNVVVSKVFAKKNYKWPDFENIILKDGLLTLDFKNNHLLQVELCNSLVNTEDFNSYCRSKLETLNIQP